MQEFITDIQQLRREGKSILAIWTFILESPRHSEAWAQTRPQGKLEIALWTFFLKQKKIRGLLKNACAKKEFLATDWQTILKLYPFILHKNATKLAQIFSNENQNTIPLLIKLLEQEKEEEFRLGLIQVLFKINVQEKIIANHLLPFLKDPNPIIRIWSLKALGEIGPKANQTTQHIIKKLQDPHLEVRKVAAKSLGQIGNNGKTILRALNRLIEKEEQILVIQAADTALRILNRKP